MFNNSFVRYLGNVFGSVLNLFIIGVGNLDRLIIGVLDSLIISDGLCNFNLISESSGVIFDVLSFIRDLFMGNHGFIVSVIFFKRNAFNIGLS